MLDLAGNVSVAVTRTVTVDTATGVQAVRVSVNDAALSTTGMACTDCGTTRGTVAL